MYFVYLVVIFFFFSMRDKIVSYKNPILLVTFALVGGLGISWIYQKAKRKGIM